MAALEAVAIVLLLLSRESSVDRQGSRLPNSRSFEAAAPELNPPGVTDLRTDEPSLPLVEHPLAGAVQPSPLTGANSGALGIVLCGTVSAADGGELDDTTIRVARPTAEAGQFEDTAGVDVERGAYAIAGLPAGACRVTCSADDGISQSVELELSTTRPVERLDFVLQRAAIIPVSFRTPDGSPLIEALQRAQIPGVLRAVATTAPLPAVLAGAPSSLTTVGNWTDSGNVPGGLDDDWDGALVLSAPLPVSVSALWERQVLDAQWVGSAGAGVTFTFPMDVFVSALGSVRARLVDAQSGAPVTGALAQLGRRDPIEADESGLVFFERVLPHGYTLNVHPPGTWMGLPGGGLMISGSREGVEYGELAIEIEVAPGEHVELGTLPMQRTLLVQGRVKDQVGRPAAASVRAIDLEHPPLPAPNTRERAVHSLIQDGSFQMRVLPGRWAFLVTDGYLGCPASIREVRTDIRDVELVLVRTAELTVEISSADVPEGDLVIRDGQEVVVCETDLSRICDEFPCFWRVRLAPGEYRLERVEGGQARWSTPFRITSDPLRLPIQLD